MSGDVKRADLDDSGIDLTVCILFFNKVEQTIECVRSVVDAGVHVHLLDNGSDETSVQLLRGAFEGNNRVRILDAGGNRGVSGGRNLQIRDTQSEWLLFLDNDITVATHDWVVRLASWIRRYPHADVFVPRLFNKHEDSWGELADFVVDDAERCAFIQTTSGFSNSFPGGASLIHRKVFEELGFYDEDLFVGFEDFELAIRGWKRGRPLLVRRVDDIELIHDHRISVSAVDKGAALVRYDVNRITKSHETIRRKHGVLLDPNFADWLREQVRQLTGDAIHGADGSQDAFQHHALNGVTCTPVHTGSASIVVLVPLVGTVGELWIRLRALALARARACAAGLTVRIRVLDDSCDPGRQSLLKRAILEGLLDEVVPARGDSDAPLQFGPMDGADFACWAGAGLVGRDFLVRAVQHARFEPIAAEGFSHAIRTIFVGGDKLGVQVNNDVPNPLVGPADYRLFPAFVAPVSVWATFGVSRAAKYRGGVVDAVFSWLCETFAQAVPHVGAPGAVVVVPA